MINRKLHWWQQLYSLQPWLQSLVWSASGLLFCYRGCAAPGAAGKAAEGSVEGSRTLPGREETDSRVWKEFGNAAAESTLNFTDSLQVVNISESREKHLSLIAATFQFFPLWNGNPGWNVDALWVMLSRRKEPPLETQAGVSTSTKGLLTNYIWTGSCKTLFTVLN